MTTQNVNVARFARNVECDFFEYFKTSCLKLQKELGSGSSVYYQTLVLSWKFSSLWRQKVLSWRILETRFFLRHSKFQSLIKEILNHFLYHLCLDSKICHEDDSRHYRHVLDNLIKYFSYLNDIVRKFQKMLLFGIFYQFLFY